jgi:uncharacterized membrane protein YedE/YeeE
MMVIDWAEFTPLTAFIGGGMIGLAAMLLMAVNGRVMGVSGILTGMMASQKRGGSGDSGDRSWRWLFIAGTLIGPFIVWAVRGEAIDITPVAAGWLLPVAGFLVGLGSAIGSGCTSGHGICGLARLSGRSFAAVGVFMTTGVITVFVLRHVI